MTPMENRSDILYELLNRGEAMLLAGAEVSRVESTLSDVGRAYGACAMNVFAITATLVVTMDFPDGERLTQTRRIVAPGPTDYRIVAAFHKLGKQCCRKTPSVEELAKSIKRCTEQPPDRVTFYLGSIFAASGFTVFFGGTAIDAIFAAVFAVLICLLQEKLAPRCPNMLMFNLLCSFIAGVGTCATVAFVEAVAAGILGVDISSTNALQGANPLIHLDKILIGEVMLLIPGIFMTNAIHDMLVGDTVAGTMRFVETILWAVALAGGFMTAIFLFDASHNVGPGLELTWIGVIVQLGAALFGAAGFAMIFHLPRPRRERILRAVFRSARPVARHSLALVRDSVGRAAHSRRSAVLHDELRRGRRLDASSSLRDEDGPIRPGNRHRHVRDLAVRKPLEAANAVGATWREAPARMVPLTA